MWYRATYTITPEISQKLFGIKVHSSENWRRWLAYACDKYQIQVPSTLFGYIELEGQKRKTINKTRHLSIGCNDKNLYLTAIGSANIDLIKSAAQEIYTMLCQEAGVFLLFQEKTGRCGITKSDTDYYYFVRRLRISGTTKKKQIAHVPGLFTATKPRIVQYYDDIKDLVDPFASVGVIKEIGRIIDKTLSKQARMLALADELDWKEARLGQAKNLEWSPHYSKDTLEYWQGIRSELLSIGIGNHEPTSLFQTEVVSVEDCVWVPASSNGHGRRMILKNVIFRSKFKLEGIWYAGLGLSYGDGQVVPAQLQPELPIRQPAKKHISRVDKEGDGLVS